MQYVLYNTLVQRMREAMTDFYTQLMEKSGFDEALVRHALNFTRDIDTSEFLRLFFDTEPFSVLPSGVLFFKEAFFPYEFFAKLKTLPLPIEKSALYVYLRLMPRGHCNFLKDDNIFFDSMKRFRKKQIFTLKKTATTVFMTIIFLPITYAEVLCVFQDLNISWGILKTKKQSYFTYPKMLIYQKRTASNHTNWQDSISVIFPL